MERRSGSVTSAPSGMQFNRTGKLMRRYVGLRNIVVIVEPSSQGSISFPLKLGKIMALVTSVYQ